MKQVLLISDSHGYLDDQLIQHAKEVDEVWHAGDWGSIDLFDAISPYCTVRGVYGNIDGTEVRKQFSKELYFECEGVAVYMTHIGGYPGRYQKEVRQRLMELKPQLYIAGHSHILKIVRDKRLNLMHFNPGAIGIKGFHKKRTMMRFQIEHGTISEVKVLEYEKHLKK